MGSIRFPQSDPIKSKENPMKISWTSNENQWDLMEFHPQPDPIKPKENPIKI